MSKLILVGSNLAALYPISIATSNGDFKTAGYILTAGITSSVRHAISDEKKRDKFIWTKYLNETGMAVIGLRVVNEFMFRNYYPKSRLMYAPFKLLVLLSCIVLKMASHRFPNMYLGLHSLWHICAFLNLGLILKNWVY